MSVDLVLTHAGRSLGSLCGDLIADGFSVEHLPLIEITISDDEPTWLRGNSRLAVCSSSYAVDYVLAHAKDFQSSSFAVLSERLGAKLRAGGFDQIRVASNPDGKTLAVEAVAGLEESNKVFVLQGSSSDSQIAHLCAGSGAAVETREVYKNVSIPISEEEQATLSSSSAVFFASPSAIEAAGGFLSSYKGNIGVIGHTTAAHLERLDFAADFVADMGSDIELLVQLKNWLSSMPR